ncbi:MAG: response regulator [Bacteroidota bacterium]
MKLSKTILLIEDDKDDQEFFIEAINGIQNAVLYYVANNGREAITILNNAVILPDIIFSDINMPMMDGIECLSQIRKNPLTRNIPVVILTTDTRRTELVLEMGAKAFIKKPSAGKMLSGLIDQIINPDFTSDSHIQNNPYKNSFLSAYQLC